MEVRPFEPSYFAIIFLSFFRVHSSTKILNFNYFRPTVHTTDSEQSWSSEFENLKKPRQFERQSRSNDLDQYLDNLNRVKASFLNISKSNSDLELDKNNVNSCSGINCTITCPKECRHICVNGVCVGCTATGTALNVDCKASCKKQFYGFPNCDKMCSAVCKNLECDSKTGECHECEKEGVYLPLCSSPCLAGAYGKHCEKRCPLPCRDSCDPISGGCTTCRYGEGPYCIVNCASMEHSEACVMYCPKRCLTFCNTTNGRCSTCASGYLPPLCEKKCPEGFYGSGCMNNCSLRCKNRRCDPVSGACYGCETGYVGEKCRGRCVDGLYGEGCALPCPEVCMQRMCHFTDGRCLKCVPGYKGNRCDELCDDGFYGQDCAITCFPKCDSGCDSVTGACWRCGSGYLGENCSQICQEGVYGDSCGQPCSTNCLERKCHHINGKCYKCVDGFRGDHCDQFEPESAETIDIIVYSISGIMVPIALCCFSVVCYKKRKSFIRCKFSLCGHSKPQETPSKSVKQELDSRPLFRNSCQSVNISFPLSSVNLERETSRHEHPVFTGKYSLKEQLPVHSCQYLSAKPENSSALPKWSLDSPRHYCEQTTSSQEQISQTGQQKTRLLDFENSDLKNSQSKITNQRLCDKPEAPEVASSAAETLTSLIQRYAQITGLETPKNQAVDRKDSGSIGPFYDTRNIRCLHGNECLFRCQTCSETNCRVCSPISRDCSVHSSPADVGVNSMCSLQPMTGRTHINTIQSLQGNKAFENHSQVFRRQTGTVPAHNPTHNSVFSVDGFEPSQVLNQIGMQDEHCKRSNSTTERTNKLQTVSHTSYSEPLRKLPNTMHPETLDLSGEYDVGVHECTSLQRRCREQSDTPNTVTSDFRWNPSIHSDEEQARISKFHKRSVWLQKADSCSYAHTIVPQAQNVEKDLRKGFSCSLIESSHIAQGAGSSTQNEQDVFPFQKRKKEDSALRSNVVRCSTTRNISPTSNRRTDSSVSPPSKSQLQPLPTPPPDGQAHLRHVNRRTPSPAPLD